eukprot:tig00000254_g22514.t1
MAKDAGADQFLSLLSSHLTQQQRSARGLRSNEEDYVEHKIKGGVGHRILEKYGWKEGRGLGKDQTGRAEPLRLQFFSDRQGLKSTEDVQAHPAVVDALRGIRRHLMSPFVDDADEPLDPALVARLQPDWIRKHFPASISSEPAVQDRIGRPKQTS